jgi:hypothetical protein
VQFPVGLRLRFASVHFVPFRSWQENAAALQRNGANGAVRGTPLDRKISVKEAIDTFETIAQRVSKRRTANALLRVVSESRPEVAEPAANYSKSWHDGSASASIYPHPRSVASVCRRHQEREAKLALPELEPADAIFEKTATKEEQRRVVRALPTTDATPPAAARPCTAHRTEPSGAGL